MSTVYSMHCNSFNEQTQQHVYVVHKHALCHPPTHTHTPFLNTEMYITKGIMNSPIGCSLFYSLQDYLPNK